MDTNTIITQVIAVSAILAPILTCIIDNIFRLKEKRMELRQKQYEQTILHRREIFENFLSAFNQVCHLQTRETLSQYSSCYSLVYIHLNKEVRESLGRINLLISKKQFDEAIKYVDSISMDILKELERVEPKTLAKPLWTRMQHKP